MWKVVIALCLFSSQGELLEHTLTDGISDCLEKKRIMMRTMNNEDRIMCGEVEGFIENMNGKDFITSIRKKGG
jgi:UTP-glucose-1-phosphate uridylyltransferase